jgi:hypothetical protein
MKYHHTQNAPLHTLLLGGAVLMAFAGRVLCQAGPVRWVMIGAALFMVFIAYCFKSLTVEDGGDHLAIRYGPLPVFRKNLQFADISGVKRGRTKFIDGWGIHYIPGRGWTYNLWGFDCAEIQMPGKVVRVGTDDPDGLVQFIHGRLQRR